MNHSSDKGGGRGSIPTIQSYSPKTDFPKPKARLANRAAGIAILAFGLGNIF